MRSFAGSLAVIATLLLGTSAHGAWQPAGLQGSSVVSLAEDPTSGTTWLAGTSAGEIFRYTEATGWLPASEGLPAGHGVLALSVDGANTWSAAGLAGLSVRSLERDPYDASILWAAANGQLQRSVDGGSTWQAVTATALAAANVQKVTLDPADLTQRPLPARTDTIYAAALGGLYRSVDAGSTWTLLPTGASGVASSDFTTIAVDPRARARVYAGTADTGMFVSTDGGNTWAPAGDGLGTADVLAITFYPQASSSLLAGTAANGIFRSDDSGRSWYAWNEGNDAPRASAVAFVVPQ